MKSFRNLLTFTCLVFFASCGQEKTPLIDWVDPLVGTGGHGHTFPGASLPFGMIQLSPDTRLEGWDGCSGYHNTDSVIYGFSHTHLSGTGVGDYGDVLLMPAQGEIQFNNGSKLGHRMGYASIFKKESERASPGYYSVHLEEHEIDVQLTVSERVGHHEYRFHEGGEGHVILDLQHRDRLLEHDIHPVSTREIEGKRISSAWAERQELYFVMQFSKDFKRQELDDSAQKAAYVFDVEPGEILGVKVAISAVSVAGARKNLESEMPDWEFAKSKEKAESAWEKALSSIVIEDPDENTMTIFYTALYHSLLAPNLFSDVDHQYRGMDGKVHQGKEEQYTVFSLWDTFRASHPLFNLIQAQQNEAFIRTLLRQYQDGGILPIWELAGNYTGCMIGYHAIPVISDAYVKGNQNFDADLALKAMVHSARQDHLGLEAYKRQGYIGVADESESVSKTLEYAYDDWCIAQLAKALGEDSIYAEFIQRAQYYKNVFNPELGFMQSKMNGAWSSGFDPAEVNFNFTEANSWQYSLFAPQDISGLINLYGGAEGFEKQLDDLFSTEMELSGRHQADITGLIGQYAHGNEPSHHMAYLYNYIGKAYKTQERVDQILREQYQLAPDGLSGNEDCGQMSAWYVLSSLGFYSVSPGSEIYAIGSPLFSKAKMDLGNGNSLRIKANNRSKENKYIQSANWNGEPLDRSYLRHSEIIQGGELVFEMGSKANPNWGATDLPISKIPEGDLAVAMPYLKVDAQTFTDSLFLEIESIQEDVDLFYSINGEDFQGYKNGIYLKETSNIRAYAQGGEQKSFVLPEARFLKIKAGRVLQLESSYSNQYSAGGDQALANYLKGGDDFRNGYWQGFYDTDFKAVLDLGEIESHQSISLGALQDIKSWIWFPTEVRFSVSTDGKTFKSLGAVNFPDQEKVYGGIVHEFELKLQEAKRFRYVRIEADNFGNCPAWHLGAGNPSWLFFDEILVN